MKINRHETAAALARWQFDQITDNEKRVSVQYKRKGKLSREQTTAPRADRVFSMHKPKAVRYE